MSFQCHKIQYKTDKSVFISCSISLRTILQTLFIKTYFINEERMDLKTTAKVRVEPEPFNILVNYSTDCVVAELTRS
jgi:hypothetical protein